MSDSNICYLTISEIRPVEHLDNLELAVLGGTQTLVAKGEYQAGEEVVFFPPDTILPDELSESLGVCKYLKNAGHRKRCRVAACRIRGVASYGFIGKRELAGNASQSDLMARFGAVHYNADATAMNGDVIAEPCGFFQYTDIQSFWRWPEVIQENEIVRVTEKIHGTNSRVGCVLDLATRERRYICGSHRRALKEVDASGRRNLYYVPLSIGEVKDALEGLSSTGDNVVFYGEIFGPKINNLDYGRMHGSPGYAIFDITINGSYLDWEQFQSIIYAYNLPCAPPLYVGPFHRARLDSWTDGPTLLTSAINIQSGFKGREGCVITPVKERMSEDIGRVVLKSVSADFLQRS